MKKTKVLLAGNNEIEGNGWYTVMSFQGALPNYQKEFSPQWAEFSGEDINDLAKKVAVAAILTTCCFSREDEDKVLELVEKINKL